MTESRGRELWATLGAMAAGAERRAEAYRAGGNPESADQSTGRALGLLQARQMLREALAGAEGGAK